MQQRRPNGAYARCMFARVIPTLPLKLQQAQAQQQKSPSSAAKCLTFGEGRTLVRTLATMSLVGQ